MKIPEIAARTLAVLATVSLSGLLGCGQGGEASNSSDRANAMEDCQAGRYEPAIAGFEKVLKSDPKDYLAHFQLATLLQDQKKDYLGAIAHFRLYLDLRPQDDKTTLAADKIEECKNMLISEKSRKGDGAPAGAGASSPADKKADRARVGEETKKLREENKKLGAENKKLSVENKNLRFILSKMGEEGKAGKGRAANLNAEVKKMLADLRISDEEGEQRKLVIPTDKELLDDEGEEAPTVSSPEVKEQIAKVTREEDSGATRPTPIKPPPPIEDNSPEPDPKPVSKSARGGGVPNALPDPGKKASDPVRPSTYVVQRGDNLMKIAERFYGTRSKWRDIKKANMTIISTDNRVKTGQTIKLP